MGTRNLTIVYLDGQYKVAQYGQWDGYPDGQGLTAFNFLKKLIDEGNLEKFKEKVMYVRQAQQEYINDVVRNKNWTKSHPELSRDTGARILQQILNSDEGIKLCTDLNFAGDSLFCEWAWLIDLDKNTFEAYQGFNTTPLSPSDRFSFLEGQEALGGKKYYPIKLTHMWNLNNLPKTEAEFLSAFDSGRDD